MRPALCLLLVLLGSINADAQLPTDIDEARAAAMLQTVWSAKVSATEIIIDMKLQRGALATPFSRFESTKNLPEPFSDKHLFLLGKFPGLKKITLIDSFVTGVGLKDLPNKRSIEAAAISGKLTDEGVKELATFPNLKDVDIRNTQTTLTAVDALLQAPKLSHLSISVSDDAIDLLVRRKKLSLLFFANSFGRQTLVLDSNMITNKALDNLSAQEAIQSLSLINTKVTDDAGKSLGMLRSLECLNVKFTSVSTELLLNAGTLPKMEELFFIKYKKGTAKVFENVPKLKYLSIYDVDAEALPGITALLQLEHLQLPNSRLRAGDLQKLASCKNLKELSIYNDRSIPLAERDAFRKAMPKCKLTYSTSGF